MVRCKPPISVNKRIHIKLPNNGKAHQINHGSPKIKNITINPIFAEKKSQPVVRLQRTILINLTDELKMQQICLCLIIIYFYFTFLRTNK